MKKFDIKDLPKLIVSLILPFVAGFIGGSSTAPNILTWYASLNKPFFTPPNWLFAPVWTILYILIGIALFLVWREGIKKENVKSAMVLFMVQLVLNTFWSVVFFGAKSIAGGFVIILMLWALIFLTMVSFYRISKTAGYLFVPYIIWVTIASALNLGVLLLNM